jgi:hypothetical protein
MLKTNNFYIIVIALVSLITVHFSYGLQILDPTNIDWLLSAYHDWGSHYLGWAFYRDEPWTFPVGEITRYNFPNGTNIGFTDSIPLLAVIFKPFSSILPEDFQYFGFWILSCYFILGIYCFKLFKLFKVSSLYILIAVLFIILNPVLIFRSLHPALCAQWVIVASFYYFLISTQSDNADSINKKQILIFALTALMTPYLTAIIGIFNILLPIKSYFLDKSISKKMLFVYPIVSVLSVLTLWYLLGMIGIGESVNLASSDSFNLMSFNLNSFFDSYGYFSKFLPKMGMVSDKQYEGFAYLGLGMIILGCFSLLWFGFRTLKDFKLIKSIDKKYLILFIACFLLSLFAITNHISFNERILFKYPLPSIVEKICYTFRATGRFIWPMYYLIFIFSLLIFYKAKLSSTLKYLILMALLILQCYDTQDLFKSNSLKIGLKKTFETKLSDKEWMTVFKNFDEIITYPPFNTSILSPLDYQDFCFLALKSRKPITNGYVARIDALKSQDYMSKISQNLRNATIEENQLFITTPKFIQDFNVLIVKNRVVLKMIDGYILIYSKNKNVDFDIKDNKAYVDSLIKNATQNDIKVESGNLIDTDEIKFYVENFNFDNNVIQIEGWAFIKNSKDNSKDSLSLILNEKGNYYKVSANMSQRSDITNTYKTGKLDNSGFKTTLIGDKLKSGNYQIFIAIKDEKGNVKYAKTDKSVEIKN